MLHTERSVLSIRLVPEQFVTKSLAEFQQWVLAQHDPDAFTDYAVRIETLGNPGWAIFVTLTGTDLEGLAIELVAEESSETDWVHYRSDGTTFEMFGGPLCLGQMFEIFVDSARGYVSVGQ